MTTTRQILLVRRPTGIPVPGDFALAEAPMPVPGAGEILVRMRVGSVDPAIRGFLDDRPSYLPPVALGAPINGMSLGEVIESNNPDYPVGTLVRAFATWSDHYVIGPDALGLEKVHPAPGSELHHYMGALGPVGLTAWVGLFAVGEAKPGETVVVSAAAGATGSTVVQIAKARGGLRERNVQVKTEAIGRVEPASLDQLLHPTIDPAAARDVIAAGLPASPGAATGAVVFTADDAVAWAHKGKKVVLVRMETVPDDIHGMHVAQGVLTATGGMTSHAAVVNGDTTVAGC